MWDDEGAVEDDAGNHASISTSTGLHAGYRWFYGIAGGAHLAPANDPTTSAAVTNAIIAAAGTSEAAMVAAMPGWLSSWYQNALNAGQRANFYAEMKGHPGVK